MQIAKDAKGAMWAGRSHSEDGNAEFRVGTRRGGRSLERCGDMKSRSLSLLA